MRKAREVLRLHHEAQLGQREIARSLGLSQSTVHAYLERAKASQLQWPLPAEMSENGLRGLLYPKQATSKMPEVLDPSPEMNANGSFNPNSRICLRRRPASV